MPVVELFASFVNLRYHYKMSKMLKKKQLFYQNKIQQERTSGNLEKRISQSEKKPMSFRAVLKSCQ